MDEDAFWGLIDDCREAAGGTGPEMAAVLKERLSRLGPRAVLDFGERWDEARQRAYTWPIWDAAVMLLGWVGDDSFRDVRAWLISHGRTTFDQILEEPDSLAELAWDERHAFVEAYDGLVHSVYVQAAGEEPPRTTPSGAIDPSGLRTDLKDWASVRNRFPKLSVVAATRRQEADLQAEPPARDRPTDSSERCPGCTEALPAHGTTRTSRGQEDEWIAEEFRRCPHCQTICTRRDNRSWRAIADSEVPRDVVALLGVS